MTNGVVVVKERSKPHLSRGGAARASSACVSRVRRQDQSLINTTSRKFSVSTTTQKKRTKRTTAGIRCWSPTQLLIGRKVAYLWKSGRGSEFSTCCGRTCK
ncbi:hypothetical protein BKA81DRAFT_346336, partial [Phyllosticta paracitricarpa]